MPEGSPRPRWAITRIPIDAAARACWSCPDQPGPSHSGCLRPSGRWHLARMRTPGALAGERAFAARTLVDARSRLWAAECLALQPPWTDGPESCTPWRAATSRTGRGRVEPAPWSATALQVIAERPHPVTLHRPAFGWNGVGGPCCYQTPHEACRYRRELPGLLPGQVIGSIAFPASS